VVRQQFLHLVCKLHPHVASVSPSRPVFWQCKTPECLNRLTRVHIRSVTAHSVTLQSRWVKGTVPLPADLEPALFSANVSALVFGIGAFVRASAAAVEHALSTWDRLWIRAVQLRGARVIFVEYFAGHFNTSDGDFAGSARAEYFRADPKADATGYPCVSLSDQAVLLARANPRHNISNQFARKASWHVVTHFEQSRRAFDEHPGHVYRSGVGNVVDCRHWRPCARVLELRTATIMSMLLRPPVRTRAVL
jgi:hypothetical protein